ncbi:hypothetical protein OS493_023073 [Desmophyllum pertusum]|uniref:Uncharacterized protein n=1 Tax=Desmophyllum pertusum TaxID=174260 RepID=A0A9W9YYK3_9CNID|nr:hypothetical protein OS493_023073 [Desmophyllum pertusum]
MPLPLRQCSCHVLNKQTWRPLRKIPFDLFSIAETAINHINQLLNLVEHRGSAATVENAQRPPAATESQTSSSSNEL